MTIPIVRVAATFIAGGILLANHTAAQQVRDAGAQFAPVGTGLLAGTVVTDETPVKPLRRATVTLTESTNAIVSRLATTDDMGRYIFSGLPPGKYSISASRPPFLRGSYGAHRMVSPSSTIVGTTVPLGSGQQITGLTIFMQPGAAISGTIRDSEGQPAASASINVWYYQWVSGTRTLVSSGGFINADDRGVYRFYGLAPGEYVLAVIPGGSRQGELMTVSDAELRRAMDLIQQPPGYAPPPASTQPAEPVKTVGWAPVFYPGTTDVSQATPIRVATGEDRGGVDLQIQLVATSRVEGTVIGIDGAPGAGLPVHLVAANGVTTEIGLMQTGQTMTDRQGKFVLSTVAPGAYSVQAVSSPGKDINGDTRPILFGSADVVLQGQTVMVTLPLAPLPAVTGRVVLDGTSPAPEMSAIRVTVARLVSRAPNLPTGAVTQPGGEFTIPAVVPDRYRVSASHTAAAGVGTWILKSVVANGQDVTDRPLDIRPGSPPSIVVTMTDRTTELSGRLTNASNQPVPDFYVIAFPEDRNAWTPVTRRIQITLPEHDGRYVFRNLPPGSYRVVAVTEVQQGEWLNPEFLAQLLDASIKVVVPDGGKVVQDMQIR